MKTTRSLLVAGASLLAVGLGVATTDLSGERARLAPATPVAAAVPPSANPLLQPAATDVEPEALARPLTAAEKAAIARELESLQTRDAAELVSVIATELGQTPAESASLLLSIAHTETRGKVLAVSPAGAAGLAQATPAAYLLEGFDGPLFVTPDYLIGTRAYIMKKPLGDAMGIAERVLEGEATPEEARELLARAKELRQLGMDELAALEPVAPEIFAKRVAAADEYNQETLDELDGLLAGEVDDRKLAAFRDGVEREYRMLLRLQQASWKEYAEELEDERDRLLRKRFGRDPVQVIRESPYEAGEVLGEELDARFSPTQMARFLSSHLATKRRQAIALGVAPAEVEAWTAALYNGGLVNVGRMRAGLLTSISETQSYMRKVPALRERLDGAAQLAAAADTHGGVPAAAEAVTAVVGD